MSFPRTLTFSCLCALVIMAGPACCQISFAPAVFYPAGPECRYAKTGDFDGDGDVDVIVKHPHNLSLFRNNGTGFDPQSLFFATLLDVLRITCDDFDGDGDQDIAVYSHTGGVSSSELTILANDGTGAFSISAMITVPQTTLGRYVASGDLNGDAYPDIITTDHGLDVRVWLNDGFGGFVAGQIINSQGVSDAEIVDIDGDGDNDILAPVGGATGSVRIHLGDGTGSFTTGPVVLYSQLSASAGPYYVLATDLDGNGSLDLVGDKRYVSSGPGGGVHVALAQSPGVFGGSTFHPLGVKTLGIAAADLNGDGLKEIATADDSHALLVMENMGAGAFSYATTAPLSGAPAGITTADVNGDGKPDLLAACPYSAVLAVLINQTQPAPYPGSGEDLTLLSGVNGPPTTGTGNFIKTAIAGDTLGLLTSSPGGTFNLAPLFLLADLFATGTSPGSVPGFYSLHFSLSSVIFLTGSPGSPFQPLLPPGGYVLLVAVPSGLAGQSVMMQSVILSPAATNGLAASDAHEIQVL